MPETIRKPVVTGTGKSTLNVGERGTDGRRIYAARVLNISTINSTPHVSVPVTNGACYIQIFLHALLIKTHMYKALNQNVHDQKTYSWRSLRFAIRNSSASRPPVLCKRARSVSACTKDCCWSELELIANGVGLCALGNDSVARRGCVEGRG